MICLNEFESAAAQGSGATKENFMIFLQLLAPLAPHVTEDIWQHLGDSTSKSIHLSEWPTYDPEQLIEDEVTIGVQINGKVRAELTIATDASKDAIETAALTLPRIQDFLADKKIQKVIVIPGKIINIVIE
jgi:leucyl-tRNA synthetase